MSLPRSGVSSLAHVFRFASSTIAPVTRQCSRCQRPVSVTSLFGQYPRRRLQTATALRPDTLKPEIPPPRNAGVPDTSIAGSVPKVDVEQNYTQGVQDSAPIKSNFSATEQEAQKSQPSYANAFSAPPPTSDAAPTRPRKSKLRPRKAAMKLTPKAVQQLQGLLDQPEPKMIRVGVKNRGCSGLAYHLEYVEKPGAFDEAVEQDGVKVLIDSKALFSIIGSEMDWIEDKLNERFIFRNPNITEQCGCGESFSIS